MGTPDISKQLNVDPDKTSRSTTLDLVLRFDQAYMAEYFR